MDEQPSAARITILTDERALVGRVRTGDREALGAIFSAYATSLYTYAHRFTRSRAAAEGLVHDVFVRIWEIRTTWRPDSVGAYLHSAVRRRALNYLRHQATEDAWQPYVVGNSGPTRSDSADEVLLANDLAAALDRAIDRLTPRCREVFVLHRQHRLSYNEIAAVLGITPKAVELSIGRALKALRALLAAYLALAIMMNSP